MSRKRFPASPAAARARGRRARDLLPHLGGPRALVGGSRAFKGTLGKQLRRGERDVCWKPETLGDGGGWWRWPCLGTAASEGLGTWVVLARGGS